MNIFEAIAVVLAPFLPVLLPGIFLVRITSLNDFIPQGARIMLWSMGINIPVLMIGLIVGIPVEYSFFGVVLLGIARVIAGLLAGSSLGVGWIRDDVRRQIMLLLGMIIIVLLGTAVFAVPFLRIHDGLPTGDVQKTIIWAQESVKTHRLPEYSQAFTLLNRDPVDFYTPGLHSLSALVLTLSPAPLTSISIFSIIIIVCIGWIAAALAKELFPAKTFKFLPALAVLLLFTEYRFLRYAREPGYHYQNAFGEFLLFGMLMLGFSFIARKRISDAALFTICTAALFFTHQFSAFIGVFAFTFGLIALAALHVSQISHAIRTHWALFIVGIFGVSAAGAIAAAYGLVNKIPAIFTLHSHLANLLPNITDYPITMGAIWFIAGILGLIFLLLERLSAKSQQNNIAFIFAIMAAAILALSQGPNLGIDIPPIRALFYSAVPLSIAGAYFFWKISSQRKSLFILICIAVASAATSSVQRAYGTLNHSVRTNSTLTNEQQYLIETLQTDKTIGAVLIDDYNRRSASWLVLSGRPMMTRIAADLERQMNEAAQSSVRKALYENQLDYEKIYALGSLPEISHLLQKHSISWVTGIADSSAFAFAHNPILQEHAAGSDTTLYKIKNEAIACDTGSICEFLLRPSTLANDIGDDEDAFEHLEASIRTPQLSEPKTAGHTTYRETTSPLIPLKFNVGDYVQRLWISDASKKLNQPLAFAIILTRPVSGLAVETASGNRLQMKPTATNIITLQPGEAEIDDKGFITLTINNPTQQSIGIDVIALGL